MKNIIEQWANMINESNELYRSELLGKITGRYRDIGDDEEEYLMANFDTNTLKWNVLVVIQNYKTGKIVDAFQYVTQEFPSIDTAVAFISDIESDDSPEKDLDESSDYELAKKLGYRGHERDVASWLKDDVAQWRKYVYETFLRLSDNDEEKAKEWFDTYDRLSWTMVGTQFGTPDGKYVNSEDVKNKLADELGDDPAAKELIKKIDDKWKADAESLREFYDTATYTGD